MSARQLSLDAIAIVPREQDPEFVAVQAQKFRRSPEAYRRAMEVTLRLARENGEPRRLARDDPSVVDASRIGPGGARYAGGVSVNDVRDELDPLGRAYSSSDWGSFIATLSRHGFLVQHARVRSLTPGRKSAYVGLYALGPKAVREAPEP